MNCLKGIAKLLLIVSNFGILICAVILVTFGIIYKLKNAGLDIMSISTYTIVVGVIIGLIAFFGCYGACSGNKFLLSTYAGILIVIFIAQVVLAVLAFLAVRNDASQVLNQAEGHLTKIYDNISQPEQLDIVNALQNNFECCGISGPSDKQVLIGNGTSLIASCCHNENSDNETCTASSNNLYKNGCAQELLNFVTSNAIVIGGIAVGFAVFELLGAGLACYARNKVYGRYAAA